MAWMSDEAWEYTQDSIEKKKTARSFRNQRTHCGKRGGMKTASDYMTRKELNAMNGEVINYPNLKKPMTWAEFKTLPDDMKVAYINWLRETFGVDDTRIAEMMGISRPVLSKHFGCWGLGKGKAAGAQSRKWDKEKFLAWSHGADPDAVNENEDAEVEEVANETPEVAESPVEDSETTSTAGEEIDIPYQDAIDYNSKIAEIFKAAEAEVGNDVPREDVREVKPVAAAPVSGSLAFEDDADRILNMLTMILGTKKVALHVEWTVVE